MSSQFNDTLAESGSKNFPLLLSGILEIPIKESLHGPLIKKRLRKFYALQLMIALLGMLPVLLSLSPAWQAFGLGMVWPGAGFLYSGGFAGVALALVSFCIFMASLFYWWARGIILLPPAVMIVSALLAGLMTDAEGAWQWVAWITPAGLLMFHFVLHRRRQRTFAEGIAKAHAFNADVPVMTPILRDAPITVREPMTEPQIVEFRRQLDLALQPIDSWEGFTTHDKWQQDSLRYQICTPTWNLAMTQYSQLPAFKGYLSQAQENLIRKHIHRDTWDYWHYESLWGNFSYAKDPVAIDNIMLSGFLGVSLGMFEAASNSSPFSADGSLPFKWDEDTVFDYSHSRLCEAIATNFKRYDLGWFPCEPRWLYSMCNLVGYNALLFHDKRHGTHYSKEISERFVETLDSEMLLPDGRLRVCTSSPFGFTVPSLSGLFGEAWGVRFLTSFAPEIAERLWQVLRRDFITVKPNGDVHYELLDFGWDTRQPSDFRKWPDINPLVVTLWSAAEMGDEEVYQGVSRRLDEKYGSGVAESLTYGKASTIRDMVNTGLPKAWREGPILENAVYPEVIVSHAVSDGRALNLVLSPGGQADSSVINIGQLKPNGRYRFEESGEYHTATEAGKLDLQLVLNGSRRVTLVPTD